MEITMRKVSELTPYEKNAKTHDDKQIANVAQSIKEMGWLQPLVIDKDGVVVVGHCRLLAAKKLKQKEVPCLIADDLTDEQIKKYRVLDNKLNESPWDLGLLAEDIEGLDFEGFDFGFDNESAFEFELVEEGEKTEEDDFVAPVPEQPNAKPGDIYQLGNHRLICGDSTDASVWKLLMCGHEARLCVTSPPYGVGMEYEEKGIEPWRKTIEPVIQNLTKYVRICCWNIGDLFATGTQFIEPTSMYSTQYMNDNGFGMMYARIWKKQGANFAGVNPYHLVSMKPVQEYEWILGYAKRDYESDYRPIQEELKTQADIAGLNDALLKKITGAGFMYGHWFTSHQWTMISRENYEKIQSWCSENGISAFLDDYDVIRGRYEALDVFQKTLTDEERNAFGQWAIWEIPTVNKRDGHPAAFPVELPARLIKMHSRKGDIVVEPFCGSGTTMIACEQLGRVCYGIERDPKYVDVIINRWETMTGKKAVLLNG